VFNIIRFLLTYTLNLFFSPLTYFYRNNGCVFSLSYHNLCCKYLAKCHLGVWIRSGKMDRSNKRLQLLKQQLLNSVTNSTHSCLSFEWYKRWWRENEDTQLALWVTLIIACLLWYFFSLIKFSYSLLFHRSEIHHFWQHLSVQEVWMHLLGKKRRG